jgi:hypothetical protein
MFGDFGERLSLTFIKLLIAIIGCSIAIGIFTYIAWLLIDAIFEVDRISNK